MNWDADENSCTRKVWLAYMVTFLSYRLICVGTIGVRVISEYSGCSGSADCGEMVLGSGIEYRPDNMELWGCWVSETSPFNLPSTALEVKGWVLVPGWEAPLWRGTARETTMEVGSSWLHWHGRVLSARPWSRKILSFPPLATSWQLERRNSRKMTRNVFCDRKMTFLKKRFSQATNTRMYLCDMNSPSYSWKLCEVEEAPLRFARLICMNMPAAHDALFKLYLYFMKAG